MPRSKLRPTLEEEGAVGCGPGLSAADRRGSAAGAARIGDDRGPGGREARADAGAARLPQRLLWPHARHPGRHLELRVPQDRAGRFSTELFERYQRSEKALVAALAEMYVQGVSTRRSPKSCAATASRPRRL
jgi:hypothetical protein